MKEPYEIIDVDYKDLVDKALAMKNSGARLVQICALNSEEGYWLYYSFGHDYQLTNWRVAIPSEAEITSISSVYPSALFYENEISELYGVKINMIAIDFQNKLYRIEQATPFKK